MDGWLDAALHWTTRGIEIGGIVVIVIGVISATATFLRRSKIPSGSEHYQQFRASLGRAILLGLEFLVAADIINTVAIEPTLESVAVLAGVVLIRTFLSFSLEVEIEGRWPWQQRAQESQTSKD